jgi:glutamine cyclotransferase
MGYVVVGAAPNEELFLVSTGGALGTLETMSFMVDEVAVTQPKIPSAELTGTGDGHLYAYYASGNTGGSTIAELDPMTGQVIAADPIAADRGTGWAFAFWGGDFWIFTTPASEQTTIMYDPVAKTSTVVAHYGSSIVGAGVSTCAPQ